MSDKIDSFWGNMDETIMSEVDGKLAQIFTLSFAISITCSANHYTISNLLYYQALRR